jgi:hypothetical protein
MYMLLAVVVLAAVIQLIVGAKRLPRAVVRVVQHFADIQFKIMGSPLLALELAAALRVFLILLVVVTRSQAEMGVLQRLTQMDLVLRFTRMAVQEDLVEGRHHLLEKHPLPLTLVLGELALGHQAAGLLVAKTITQVVLGQRFLLAVTSQALVAGEAQT